MKNTVIGLFDSRAEALAAKEELVAAGIPGYAIDISMKSEAPMSGDSYSGAEHEEQGGIVGFFKSLFGDNDDDVRRYSDAAGGADAILTVHAESSEGAASIAAILDRNGALDIDEVGNRYGSSDDTRQMMNQPDQEEVINIPIIEEELNVGKRTVEGGGVRVRSRIVERPVEESLRLREEHVYVQRRPANRPVAEGDLNTFQEGEIELTEHSEQAVVQKQSRVVEEVEIGKNVSEREETIHDTVRRTEAEVEEMSSEPARR